MIKVTCDRCRKKVKNPKGDVRRAMCIYTNPIKRKYASVDLCDNCQKELSDFMDMAESYFMNNKHNPTDIFDKSKYYKE